MKVYGYTGSDGQQRKPGCLQWFFAILTVTSIIGYCVSNPSESRNKAIKESFSQSDVVGYWEDMDYDFLVYRIRKDSVKGYVFEMGDKKTMTDWSRIPDLLSEQYIAGYRVFFCSERKISDRHICGSVLGEEGYYDGDYFVIDSYGDLKCFDWFGYICTFQKIQ